MYSIPTNLVLFSPATPILHYSIVCLWFLIFHHYFSSTYAGIPQILFTPNLKAVPGLSEPAGIIEVMKEIILDGKVISKRPKMSLVNPSQTKEIKKTAEELSLLDISPLLRDVFNVQV